MQHHVPVVWSQPARAGARWGLLQVRAGFDAVAHIMFTEENEAGSTWTCRGAVTSPEPTPTTGVRGK